MNTPEQKANLQRLNPSLARDDSFYRIRTGTPRMVREFGPFYVLDVYRNLIASAAHLPKDVQRSFDALYTR